MGPPLSFLGRIEAFVAATLAKARSNPAEAHIVALRVLLVCSLATATAVCTVLAYTTLHAKENALFGSKFEFIAERALSSMGNRLERMSLGVQSMASTYSHLYPNSDDWPNVAWRGFDPTASLDCPLSSLKNIIMLPIVRPEQAAEFECFLSEFYENNPYVPKEIFSPPTLRNISIWTQDFYDINSVPYRDVTGEVPFSSRNILTPAAQYTLSAFIGPYFGAYNVHSNPLFAGAIDRAIECSEQYNHTHASVNCGMLSEVLQVPLTTLENPFPVLVDMLALNVFPIFPFNNQSELTGLTAGVLSWRELLVNVVPALVSEVDCVIETNTKTFTFGIRYGVPTLKGIGDLHDAKFTSYGKASTLRTTGANLTYYPTQSFENEYITNEPLYAAGILFGAFLFCSLVFGCYDLLMRRDATAQKIILDTKRRYVRFISHEIRTPLNTVRLGLKLFEVELSKLAARIATTPACDLNAMVASTVQSWTQLTHDILLNSESAVEVLNDLLNYDKIEMGTLHLEFALFNFTDLIKRTCSIMKMEAQQKNVDLELSFNIPVGTVQRGCSVIGDEARLGQVLRNLVSNALKFTPAGGTIALTVGVDDSAAVHVTPKTAQQSEPFALSHPAGICRVSVKDSGAGLTPQQLSQICSEGVQFNANELQAGQGSGLGLFISKGIVEQHGGKVTVASDGLGMGSTFTFELPYSDCPSYGSGSAPASLCYPDLSTQCTAGYAALSATEPASPPGTRPETPRKPAVHRLLVVDDSIFNRRMLTKLLASKEYECEQAEDGQVALDKYATICAKGGHVDAVLMDFEMPVMNGPTATKKLREMGCTALIVGVTGNVLPDEVSFFKQQGADAVLPKPLVLEEFEMLFVQRDNITMYRANFATVESSGLSRKSSKSMCDEDTPLLDKNTLEF